MFAWTRVRASIRVAPGSNPAAAQRTAVAVSWQPSASLDVLHARAHLLHSIRRFFADREVLEVETPLLAASGVTDPSLEPFEIASAQSAFETRYLQTSPEYAMKRLLAAHEQSIYQVTKAFRDGEVGTRHNPEFSLLEWYRPGFDHHQLMEEVAELLLHCLGDIAVAKVSYRQLFQEQLAIDPWKATASQLAAVARKYVEIGSWQDESDKDFWLDLLMSHVIEPRFVDQGVVFVFDYPPSQAALARIADCGSGSVAQRFEAYVNGIELANGYYELTDAVEQSARFERDNTLREQRGQVRRPVDPYLLAAMDSGLPDCSGVALGLDRLLMLYTGNSAIQDVLAFDWTRA